MKNYNLYPKDIRMEYISLKEAINWINNLKGKWVYIKFHNTCFFKNNNYISSVYTKFKVSFVQSDDSSIFIYGRYDEDKLVLSNEEIIQTESTIDEDEIKLLLKRPEGDIEIFLKLFSPNIDDRFLELKNNNKNLIITEGKTDWKYLKNALNTFQEKGQYRNLKIDFFEYEELNMGNKTLEKLCNSVSIFDNEALKIFLFDSDDESINKNYTNKKYINHGNSVFSMILPVPDHRKNTPLISTENLYLDEDIKKEDGDGRRLYLANEFDMKTGQHKIIQNIYHPISSNIESNYIIDNKVFIINTDIENKSEIMQKKNGNNLALSKNQFSNYILEKTPPFDSMNIDSFKIVFDIITDIYTEYEYDRNSNTSKNFTEISKGIKLNIHENGFQDLYLYISLTKEYALKFKMTQFIFWELSLSQCKKNIILSVFDKNKELLFCMPIKLNEQIINFLYKKLKNNSNRIYIHVCDEQRNFISKKEILHPDLNHSIIGHILQQIYN